MGLQNREAGNFITILGGKFSIRVPEGTKDSKERVNKLGKTVHEKFYDSFTAKLVGIKTQESPYGKNWLFAFKDGAEVYNLQLSYSNSFATAFLKMLPNIDVTKEMKLQPVAKEVDGKMKSSLFVSQEGVTIKHAYTKDKPNGLPQMEQISVKGQLVWDDTKRLEFLHAMVDKDILPKLPQQSEVAEVKEEKGGMTIDDVFGPDDKKSGEEDDELGF